MDDEVRRRSKEVLKGRLKELGLEEGVGDDMEEYVHLTSSGNMRVYGNKIRFLHDKISPKLVQLHGNGVGMDTLMNAPMHTFHDDLEEERLSILESAKVLRSNGIKIYTCPKCKKKDQTYEERQTRSSDEASTIICTCNMCGHVWRAF